MNKKTSLKSPINLARLSEDELIALRINLEKEFRLRKVKFNTGEIGETLAINFFNETPGLDNLQRAPTGTKNVDALSRKGDRYSIKSIKDGIKTGTIYPDSNDESKQLFEFLLIVQINDDYGLHNLHRFTWKQFLKVRKWDKTMNAWYIPKTLKALNEAEILYGENKN